MKAYVNATGSLLYFKQLISLDFFDPSVNDIFVDGKPMLNNLIENTDSIWRSEIRPGSIST